jgi:hypothetical protein
MSATVIAFPQLAPSPPPRRRKKTSPAQELTAALPFVRDRKRGEKGGRCFWSVKPTGEYLVDYHQGYGWSRLVLPLLKYNVGAPLVSWIVADMIRAGDQSGLALGFIQGLASELACARLVASASMKVPTDGAWSPPVPH